ncbi:HTH-type transcriptional regulator GltC (plasmid) [Caballeronia sp. SBC1]|uniref:LysR family transcriptional regulator n=1 Tax=unclassified Caballeronia TaxID=2646786 RepID=UPI0013E1E2DE|nr:MULTISPECIES: LysR family transcriptional regulator [unclassified Caballeronia]QIE28071.1 HTH-type transcriptional regulator GltC [Caballeronia sp. SBC2]QIN66135.1 HTH-type transcriptional regulator GltC [Caballeronia sp. SBC1]
MRIDIESLRVFMAVVEEGSIATASRALHLVASAASKRISDLEKDAGSALFYRHSRGVLPTPAGDALYSHAKQIFEQFRQIDTLLSEYSGGIRGHVRLSVTYTAMVHYLPDDLRRFTSEHPEVRIELVEKTSDVVVRMVENGVVDFGICAVPDPSLRLTCLPYRVDRLFLVVPVGHLYASRKSIGFNETLDHDYVGMQEGASIHTLCTRAAEAANRRLKLRIQVTNFEAVRNMVAAGLGIGILPEVGIPEHERSRLVSIPLDEPWSSRPLNIVCRDLENMPAPARMMVEQLTQSNAPRRLPRR